jgi:hypothetical protein
MSLGASSHVDPRKRYNLRDFILEEVSLLLFNTENKRILIRYFANIVGRIQACGEGHRIYIISQYNTTVY